MSKKKEKEKVIYYDDDSTISDMSNVGGVRHKQRDKNAPKSTAHEKARTFWEAFKMMLPITFIVLGVMAMLYVILLLLASC